MVTPKEYPLYFEMNNAHIDIDFEYHNNSIYELYSIINYMGKIYFNHYYYHSYIKWFDDNLWYEYDDLNYKLLGNSLVDYDTAYLLSNINKNIF